MSHKHALKVFNALDPREVFDPTIDLYDHPGLGQLDEPDEQDRLDALLVEAWEKMSARLRRDRAEAWRRFQRSRSGAMARPVREFCVTLRANDTRMDDWWGFGMPKGAIEARAAHTLWLNGDSVRDLTAPVRIMHPGLRARDAAAALGMTRMAFDYWLKHAKGLRVDYTNPHHFNHNGKPVPVVWTPSPIDPCRPVGQVPHPMWGHLWQFLGTRVPAEMELFLKREPRWRRRGVERVFCGWDFICPGRRNEKKRHIRCGRRCRRLFLPVPVMTIGAFLGDVEGFEVEARCAEERAGHGGAAREAREMKLAGRWHPETDAVGAAAVAAGAGGMGFACDVCWRPQYLRLSVPSKAWHVFVRTMSGGLLHGRDVPMPAWLLEGVKVRRRKALGAASREAVDDAIRTDAAAAS